IEQDQIENAIGKYGQGGLSIVDAFYLVAFFRQPVCQSHHEARLIFDQQNSMFHTGEISEDCTTGSEMQNVEPVPRFDATWITPLCCSTACLTRLKPRPLPWIWSSIAQRPR